MATIPAEHIAEAKDLVQDAYVDLYRLKLAGSSTTINFTNFMPRTWQGNAYDTVVCSLSGDQQSAEGQEARPTMVIQNPGGVFTALVTNRTVEMATITRYRVLRPHYESNLNIYARRMWYVSRIKDIISGRSFTLELRAMSEGPGFFLPARMYVPPEFPIVRI